MLAHLLHRQAPKLLMVPFRAIVFLLFAKVLPVMQALGRLTGQPLPPMWVQ